MSSSSLPVFQRCLADLFSEVLNGPPGQMAFVLNPGDPGLLKQLDSIDAKAASSRPMPGKTTIAAHVDHVHFGMTLLNRWAAGEENPFATADWEASWKRGVVTDEQWKTLRANLRREVELWHKTLTTRAEWDEVSASGAISSAAHTAYHLGAIRQILAALS